jgi:serine protease Do
MSTRKSTMFYSLLLALASVAVGMVIASRLDLAPASFGSVNVPATNSAPLDGPLDAATFRNIAQANSPAVVSIITQGVRQGRSIADFFDFDGPVPNRRGGRGEGIPVRGAGSGFIVDDEGYILTNNHVVADADEIQVKLLGMSDLPTVPGLRATLVGRDELTDTALLKLEEMPSQALVEAKFGDSEQIAPGDWVMAIGNPYSLSHTVTVGVVSAVGRPQETQFAQRFEKMIQTDAAINRGNSGGPLLNLRGEVVGINTMILADNANGGGNLGIGFAVPINTVRDILPQLRTGKVVRGVIGVSISRAPMTEAYARDLGLSNPNGAEVSTVTPGGPADKAGIRVGDVITEFNGRPVGNDDSLVSMVVATRPDTTVPVKLVRDRKTMTVNVTVGELNLEAEQQGLRRATAPTPDRPEPVETDFGMVLREITPNASRQLSIPTGEGGAIVESVEPLSPAFIAGLQPGDVILRVGTADVRSLDDVTAALDAIGAGRVTRVIVWRPRQGGGGGDRQLLQLRRR